MHESVIDPVQKELDPMVFDNTSDPIVLLPNARKELLNVASHYSRFGKVTHVFLIGSMTTLQWAKDSDLDLTVMLVPSNEEMYEAAWRFAVDTVGALFLSGTQHPINAYVCKTFDPSVSEGVYDVVHNRWIKKSRVTQPIDLDQYMDAFDRYVRSIDLVKGELSRDLIDYKKLRRLDGVDHDSLLKKVREKLEEIQMGVQELVSRYKVIHALRKLLFSGKLTDEELRKYQEKTRLPVNVIYKLLEHYHYTRFLSQLEALSKREGGIQGDQDIDDLLALVSKGPVHEMTGSGAAGGYEVPLGAAPSGRGVRRRKKDVGNQGRFVKLRKRRTNENPSVLLW